VIRPTAIREGARVALVAPAGPLAEGAVDRAAARVSDAGWVPVIGQHARGRRGFLSGSDADRVEDLNAALTAPDIDAIWCLRGGYGTIRILDRVRWNALAERPRPLIGFSDNTALHIAARRVGVVTFHGPHPAVEDLTPFSADLLRRVVTSTDPVGELPFPPGQRARTIVPGIAEGPLVGGNLSVLAALSGTAYAMHAPGSILFVEEVGEPAYRVDRLFSQLRMSGALDGLAGVVVGAFSESPDDEEDGMPSTTEILLDRLDGLGIPVASGFPFGHIPDSWTIPVGGRARLDAAAGTLEILEATVS
jgi:muramoyltetrapeptide carboxypeptidase